ncbi:MAG UNVERIFIED_CONTAM: hypothetical protein LVT10_22865 [Anaerolineae bacterium]
MDYQIEIEVPKGLEDIASRELQALYSGRVANLAVSPAILRFDYSGNLGGLLALQTVYSVYVLLSFDIPRPKALLGHQFFTYLVREHPNHHGFASQKCLSHIAYCRGRQSINRDETPCA